MDYVTVEMNTIDWDYVKGQLEVGKTYGEVASTLNVNVNTFIKWCRAKGVRKRTLADQRTRLEVSDGIREVCFISLHFCL